MGEGKRGLIKPGDGSANVGLRKTSEKIIMRKVFLLLVGVCLAGLTGCAHVGYLPNDVGCVKKYNFSEDWISTRVAEWAEALQRFKGKPGINYLEIGVFEGRSLIWMLDNILTHPTARAACIDIFPGDTKKVLSDNLAVSGFTNKVKVITGKSQIELKLLPHNSFDFIYIDGSHVAADVLVDAVLSWQLLKNDGLIIFDDYLYKAAVFPLELRPQAAIDAFITAYRNNLEIVHHGYQVILRKKSEDISLLSLGQYVYYWKKKELCLAGTNRPIKLSDSEIKLIERLFMARKFGETKFILSQEILENPDFVNLMKRLKLDLGEDAG